MYGISGVLFHFGKKCPEIVSKVDTALKSALLSQSNLFEALNLRYFGPVDGHDVDHLVAVMKDLKSIKGPKILHCVTVKERAAPAETGNKTTGTLRYLRQNHRGDTQKVYDTPKPKYQGCIWTYAGRTG